MASGRKSTRGPSRPTIHKIGGRDGRPVMYACSCGHIRNSKRTLVGKPCARCARKG